MGKALKTAGVIIGAAALIATGVGALAMPGLAGATTLMGVSTGTLNTISSGLVAVGGMLDKPKSQGSAQPDEWTSNPDQPIPFLFGRMGVAGKIVQRDEFGPDNMYQGIVGIISGAGPIKGIQSFKGDDQAVTFGANGIAVTSQWQGEMWMVRRAGNQPDTALAVPQGLKVGQSTFQWSSSARLSGKACYLQILGENSKGTAYPAGIPDPVHVGEGVYGYDPRYDSTYPGGDGPCRLGVRSTYRYIDDPIIAGLNWALGMVENGQVVGGIGASPDGIDMPAFVECANISEANGWKVAAWPDTSEDASSVLDQFLQAGGAVRARHAGKISCVPRGAPRASVVTVTARDMAGSIELNAAPSLFDQLNTITPRFMSEAAGWKLTPANPVSFAQYVTDDGGKHSDQIDYRFVPLVKQAAELAAYDILDAREPFSGSVPLKPHMRQLKRGDCFVIDNPGVLLDGVKCIVLSRSYDPKTAEVRISFRSETDGKHDLALGKTTTLPDFPVLTPTDPTYVSPPLPEDWVIVPRPPGTGGQVPGFDLSGQVGNDTATAIHVEWWEVPTGVDPNDPPPEGADWQSAGTWPPTATVIPIDVQPDRYYWIGLTYIRNQNYSERVPSGPWLSGKLISDDVDPNAPGLDQIKGDIQEAFGDLLDLDLDLAAARLALEQADAALAQEIGGVEDRAEALESVTASLEANKASISQLNAQITRLNNVEAVNATQATQIIDLGNNKVSLTEYNTLKAEVQNARDGATTLLGRIQQLNSVDLDLQLNKASVQSVTNLTARTTATEADIIDLEIAQANETSARVADVQQLTARTTSRGNLLRNSTAALGMSYWTGAVWSPALGNDINGPHFFNNGSATGNLLSDHIEGLSGGQIYTLQADVRLAATTGTIRALVEWFSPTASLGYSPVVFTANAGRQFAPGNPLAGQVTAPSTATRARVLFNPQSVTGLVSMAVRRIKLEWGSLPATAWTDEATVSSISASVTQQSLAIIDLENNAALASWQVKALASGGKPAIIQAVSSALGNYIAFGAEQIYFGDNTVFDDATDTLQTTIGGYRRVLAFGAPFGTSGNLLEWWGPDSVALGAMATGNGLNGRMTTPPYVFDNTLPSGGSVTGVGTVPVTLDSTTKKTIVTADIAVTASSMIEAAFSVMGENGGPLGGNNTTFQGGWEITERASPSGGETVVWSGTWTATQDAEGLKTYTSSPDGFQPARRPLAAGLRRYALRAWRVSGTTTWIGAGNLTVRKT